jgi:hypothetical protein
MRTDLSQQKMMMYTEICEFPCFDSHITAKMKTILRQEKKMMMYTEICEFPCFDSHITAKMKTILRQEKTIKYTEVFGYHIYECDVRCGQGCSLI